MLVQRVLPKVTIQKIKQPLVKNFSRATLQKISSLKSLMGHSFSEKDITMIIPGGMNMWEKLYKGSTGNYPKSVMERWFEKSSGSIIHEGDYEVKIGTHLTGDPAYEPHPVNPDEITSRVDDIMDDLDDADGDGIPDTDTDTDDTLLEKIWNALTGQG